MRQLLLLLANLHAHMAKEYFSREQQVKAVILYLQLKSASAAAKELKDRGIMEVSYKSIIKWAKNEETLAQAKAQAPAYQTQVLAFESRDDLSLKVTIEDATKGSVEGLKKVIDKLNSLLDDEKKKLNVFQLTAIGTFFLKSAGLDRELEGAARSTNHVTIYQQILNTGKPIQQ